MKIHIHVNSQPINGYNNIDLSTSSINLDNLNNICERSECKEMILNNVLSYIPFVQISPFLSKLITLLRFRGKIIIEDTDISLLLNQYINGIINLKDFNDTMFGQGKIKKASCFTIQEIENIIKNNSLKIESIEFNSNQFILIAKRTS